MQKYAKGSRAWGICGRSGRKMLLKDMIMDGRYPNMRVDPAWDEDKHPLEFLPKVEDPVALYRPAPETIAAPTAPVMMARQTGVTTISATWTPAETDITEITSYTLSRSVDSGAFAIVGTFAVLRDFLGGIIGVQNCTTVPSVPTDDTSHGSVYDKTANEDAPITYTDNTVSSGHTYCYQVFATPMGNNQSVAQGPPSASSNIACAALVLPQATTPVLSGSLSGLNVILNWTASTIAFSTIANYQVYRSVDGGAFSLWDTVAGNVLTDSDTTAAGHTVQYYVVAIPVAGLNSNPSNTVTEFVSNDPFWADVVLMLHLDGVNGGTTFTDSSTVNNTVISQGGAALTTTNPKFGTASLNLPGTNSSQNVSAQTTIVHTAPLDILSGTQDFTIDGWFFLPPGATQSLIIMDYGDGIGAVSYTAGMVLTANPNFFGLNNSAIDQGGFGVGPQWASGQVSGSGVVSTNAWHHFAIVRHNGTGTLYLDGVAAIMSGAQWINYAFPAFTSYLRLGMSMSISGVLQPGMVDEVRVTAGIARWTSNFTPPTAPTVP